jgi:hypothetical protein
MASFSQLRLHKNLTVEELLKAIWQLPVKNQLALAEKIRKKALRSQWNDFMRRSDIHADIADEDIIKEVKLVRAARYAQKKRV